MSNQSGLLRARRFAPLFVTQFLGALNDNVLKNAMVVLLTFQAASWTTLKPELLANLAAGMFILPFFLFSATAGQLADKYDKAALARMVKLLEIAIVLICGAGFWLHSLAVLFVALFLLGLHSTLFGPVKYAILPQHLKAEELVGGNALIEAGTFVAILLGHAARRPARRQRRRHDAGSPRSAWPSPSVATCLARHSLSPCRQRRLLRSAPIR
jgi:MFS family permease